MNKPSRPALKILYAIQGTGNGHVARAREIIPILQQYGDLDIVLSGDQSSIELPAQITYRSKGLTFLYNKKGGVSLWRTWLKNNFFQIIKEIIEFPIEKYDIIINDFEFISAWSAKLRGKKVFGLGHQTSFLSPNSPRPNKREWIGEMILKNYAPCTYPIGFHFEKFDSFIQKPVIRQEIRDLNLTNEGHYTVYLPAFGDDQLFEFLSQIKNSKWQVFSKRAKKPYNRGNVFFQPTSNEDFIKSFASCEGILTSAGFETPAEALQMGKKLFAIPIKNQYEQYCNAEALRSIGVPIAYGLDQKCLTQIAEWVKDSAAIKINYPDTTTDIIREEIFHKFYQEQVEKDINIGEVIY